MCMCHYYYSSLLLFAKTERMLSASYLFIFSLPNWFSASIKRLPPTQPYVNRLSGDEWPLTQSTPPCSPSLTLKMACTVLSVPPSPSFGPVKKGKMGFLQCHFQTHIFGPDEIFFSMFVPPAQSGVSLWVLPSRRLSFIRQHKATWDAESSVK